MIVTHKYAGQSAIVNALDTAQVAFATDTLREATFFRGTLGHPLVFREALATLHEVVTSDFKYRPRDRTAFKLWLTEQDQKFVASLGMKSEAARKRMEEADARLMELDGQRKQRLAPFYRARAKYFEYVYEDQYELSYLFDPVITVHPDELSFEAFSRDESSYARLAAKYELFEKVDELACGTTNIDFSVKLHRELDRMRSYRSTRFEVTPSGFTATTGENSHREKKIELPDSWVMGFLQVHSTLTLGLTRFTLLPIDLFNICRFLRLHKAKTSPRALRYELTPGQPVKVVFEPWNHTLTLSPASVYQGPKPAVIRTWGRDRLRTLARLMPVLKKIDVYLAGFGLPSIYLCDLGPLTFTLALSGWTENDWTGSEGKFDLLTRKLPVSAGELSQVYEALRTARFASDAALATTTGLGVEKTRSALSHLCQVGRAMFDLGGGVFRHRELFLTPFSPKQAVSAGKALGGEKEKAAQVIHAQGDVRLIMRRPTASGFKLSGSAKGADGRRVRPLLTVDKEGRVVEGECTCEHFRKHKLTHGPCEHLLSLRLAHMARLEAEDTTPKA